MFLYTAMNKFNNENKNIVSFIIVSKKPKHLGIDVTTTTKKHKMVTLEIIKYGQEKLKI